MNRHKGVIMPFARLLCAWVSRARQRPGSGGASESWICREATTSTAAAAKGEVTIPEDDTVLRDGDRLTIIGDANGIDF